MIKGSKTGQIEQGEIILEKFVIYRQDFLSLTEIQNGKLCCLNLISTWDL